MKHPLTVAALCVALSAVFGSAYASDPGSHDVALPTVPGEVVVIEWTGTALPGGSGQGSTGGIVDPAAAVPCPPVGPDDAHAVNLTVPSGIYDAVNVTADFHIEWEAGTEVPGVATDPDLVLTVYQGGTALGSSDGGDPQENVGLVNPEGGTYTAIVCPYFASQPTAYSGKLTLTARSVPVCLTGPTKAIAHSTVPSGFGGLKDQELPGFANLDIFRNETAAIAHPVPVDLQGRQQSSLYDRAQGKTTFLWARTDAPVATVGALNGRELLIERARAHLRSEAKQLNLSPAMIADAEVFDAQYNGNGPAVVRFRQRVNGYEVFHRSLNVLLDRFNKPVAVSGYFATDYNPAASLPFIRTAPQAIATAWASLGGTLDASQLTRTATRGAYEIYSTPNLAGSHQFERAPRVKALYYPRNGALEPAYFVELFARARANHNLSAYAFVVSATDGQVLHRANLKASAAYNYRVFADTNGPLHQPFDMPLGNGYTPFPGAQPTDTLVRTGVSTNLVTLDNAGIVTGDPWLEDGATETISNHVDACLDAFDNAGNGVLSTPTNTCDPELGDLRPAPNGPNTFDYEVVADSDPSTPDAQAASVVNLFYINNWLHDWWYNHGFDEVSGNAQTSNFGRGGEEGDPVKAQGQDASGRNNANMSTPSDGSSPTMQQYLFDGPAIGEVRETAPTDSGPLKFVPAAFGPNDYDITQEVVLANDGAGVSPSDGCGAASPDPTVPTVAAPPQTSLAGKIALIDRGNCNFTAKAQFAMLSGAAGMIVVNNTDGEPIAMGNGDVPVSGIPVPVSPTDTLYQIASVMIRRADAQPIKDQLATAAVTMHMERQPAIDVDGTLDNQIVAHEYFHYVHHRLTASSNNQSGSMSEGWGDIDAFMLSVRPDDTLLAGNGNYQGAYGLAGYVVNNFFAGIRRAPYSTDFDLNAFTFKHIADGEATPDGGAGASNSEVHNAGEIWAEMMFECYAGLLNDPRHSFSEAQSRMQDYIIGGFKMTPADATYTEARDAVLSVALANDFEDYRSCSHGFAKRGNGLNAVAPARSSTDHVGVVEDYTEFVCDRAASGAGGVLGDNTRFGGALPLSLLLGLISLLGLRRVFGRGLNRA
jgi:hypothetical protein